MPASGSTTIFQGLEVTGTAVDEPDPIYWTDEKPKFELHFQNTDSCKYEWNEDSKATASILIDGRQVHAESVPFGPLEYGESTTCEIGGELLAFEGHGTVLVTSGIARPGEDGAQLTSGKAGDGEAVYTFSVWDESHYNSTVRRPKQLQYATIFTSLILILFAGVQLYLASGGG